MSEREALKQCPFCGGVDENLVQAFTRATDTFAYWSVECLGCGCEIASDASQAEADEQWNTRALAMPDREAKLEAALILAAGQFASIREANDADDPDSYRADDREGCLDWTHAMAEEAEKAARHVLALTVGGGLG